MKRKFTLALIIALCGLLSSCKKPISGQVFVVTEAGVNFPLGAVQVEVVSGKDADDFMRQRQAEIESKVHSLQAAYDEAKTNYVLASKTNQIAQDAVAKAFIDYTNDPQYIELINEKNKDLKVLGTLEGAIAYLQKRAFPNWGTMSITTVSPEERDRRSEAYNAMHQDETRCGTLRTEINSLNEQCEAFRDNFMAPYRDAQSQTFNAVEEAQSRFANASEALKNFPVINNYFDGFSPAPVETTVTDAEGNFIIQNPKAGAKVFAKAQRQTLDSVETYFWLVDLPATGEKFILSNNNMFTVPASSP